MSKSDQVRGPIGRTMLLVTFPPPAPNGNLGYGLPQDISDNLSVLGAVSGLNKIPTFMFSFGVFRGHLPGLR